MRRIFLSEGCVVVGVVGRFSRGFSREGGVFLRMNVVRLEDGSLGGKVRSHGMVERSAWWGNSYPGWKFGYSELGSG